MNTFSRFDNSERKKQKFYNRVSYLRRLIQSSGIERLGPSGRRKILKEEVKPIGVHAIDDWRIRRHLDATMDYVHMALDDTEAGKNLIGERNEAEKLELQKADLNEQIGNLERTHEEKSRRFAREEISLQEQLEQRTQEIAEQNAQLDQQLEKMMRKVQEAANQINKKSAKEEIDLVCVPGIRKTYSGRLGVCADNGKYNGKILRENDHKFILIEVNGTLLGHIKIRGEDTFLSYVNAVNEDGKKILRKGGIYTIEGRRTIMKEVQVQDDGKSYICVLEGANFNRMRMSRIRRRDELIDAHVEKINNGESVRIQVDL